MGAPELLNAQRHPAPEDLHLEDRSDKIFSMFDGPEETVTLRIRPYLIGQVMDQFGEKIEIINKRENRMDVRVTVHLSPTFYGWLAQFGNKMQILSPASVKKEYRAHIESIIE